MKQRTGPPETDQDLRGRFLDGMSHAACTVNIVTTDGPAGRAGVTVSAMASVSADTARPTLLVCVHHLSPAASLIAANGVLCINVLRDDQAYISDTFAGRFKDEIGDKFDCTDWITCATGAPRIADPLVAFDCVLTGNERVGTHHIFLCEVQDTHKARAGSPLIYANRAYGSSRRIEPARSVRAGRDGLHARVAAGCFVTFAPYVMPRLIASMNGTAVDLVEGDQRRLTEALAAGEIELALMYQLDLDPAFETIPLGALCPHVLLADGHPLTRQSEITPAELAEEQMVLLDIAPSRDYFTGLMTSAGVTPMVAHRTASLEMVRGLVGHGLGYALLVTKPASEMTYDGLRLVVRPLVGDHAPSRIVIAHRRGQDLSPAAASFVDRCLSQFTAGRATD